MNFLSKMDKDGPKPNIVKRKKQAVPVEPKPKKNTRPTVKKERKEMVQTASGPFAQGPALKSATVRSSSNVITNVTHIKDPLMDVNSSEDEFEQLPNDPCTLISTLPPKEANVLLFQLPATLPIQQELKSLDSTGNVDPLEPLNQGSLGTYELYPDGTMKFKIGAAEFQFRVIEKQMELISIDNELKSLTCHGKTQRYVGRLNLDSVL